MTALPCVLPDLLRARAAVQPGAVGMVVDGVGSMTFREWDERSNAFARGLAARGIRPSDRVGLIFDGPHWLDYAVAFFGTLKAGATAAPMPIGLPAAQIERIVTHWDASALCCPATAAHTMPRPTWDPEEIVADGGCDPYQAPVDPEALAQVLYTSGTAGPPKGVACSHANLLHGIVIDDPDLARARRTRIALHALPVGVNAAQVELTRSAHRLARTVIAPAFDPERFASLVAEHGATVLLLVPAMAILLVNAGSLDRHDMATVERVRLTGAPSAPALFRKLAAVLPSAEIVNEYALTESTPMAVTAVYDQAHPGAVGRPSPGVEVRVVGPAGQTLGAGAVGEVWMSSPGVPMRSYYRNPEATARRFSGGWLRTGDLGYLDPDGFLYLSDRRDDMIVTGGQNVSSLDVEAVLQECPAVAEAAAIGVPHPVLGEHVGAAVVLRTPATAAQIKAFARQHLAEHAVPQTILFFDRLPRGVTGKVRKTELRGRMAADRRPEPVAPRTATEERVARIWAAVLALGEVSVVDRFIDLGGQSLSAMQVLAGVWHEFGVKLEPIVLTQAETVAALATVLDGSELYG